ncbi:hypothetical protein KAFR_0B03060 [Kazachstania africana CBS 2517]|uniref:VPS37 C-terminal domain-containing protein n=1 Tax=Kazachstania africana (strain ATCC 22294 / BCRC 22015 / CBS 2517 / CECT 1963 / NBRC 1671 / NRRL Y-8276) TaxID=1071382 RepID=H2AQF2_KAZAF|nr:hypothetical protein KAFR_0B03060 [Kazachstania africana CBS 2517]CCF56602.1 hypothetical protein KAFR_0B03060 [Kazachstania africana CBS 2517]
MNKLPEHVELLSANEIQELGEKYKTQLKLYVSKFQDVSTLIDSLKESKDELSHLQNKFNEIEESKKGLTTDLESLRILNSEYSQKWQELSTIISDNYSEAALKHKLENQVKEYLEMSDQLEASVYSTEGEIDSSALDDTLKQYMETRINYHRSKEHLATWNAQGYLRK